MNFQAYQIEQQIKELLSHSGLQISEVYYLLNSITQEIFKLYMEVVTKEQQQLKIGIKENIEETLNSKSQQEETGQE